MARIIRKKNPRKPWTVRYFHEGRQRERSFVTKGEADAFIAKFEHDRRESIFADPREGKILFNDYARTWIGRRAIAARSKDGYRTVLNAWVGPAFAGKTLAQVARDREAVQDLLLVTMPAKVGSGRIRQAQALINGVVKEAVTAGKIPAHRLAGIEVPTDAAKPEQIISVTPVQVAALAGRMRRDLAVSVWLMYGCGLRVSEALAVRLTAFRDNGLTLRVSEQVTREGGTAPLKRRTASEYRDVPVPSWLWEKVQTHAEEFGTDDGYLFGRNGKRVTYGGYKGGFSSAACKAGLPDYGPHQLRHAYASMLLSKSVPISDVSKWLGHRDINITVGTYGHLVPDSWTRGRAALEGLAA